MGANRTGCATCVEPRSWYRLRKTGPTAGFPLAPGAMTERERRLFDLAKPYYLKGRPGDLEHVAWMGANAVTLVRAEKNDRDLLIPLALLHDIGYAALAKRDPADLDVRRAHMAKGAELVPELMRSAGYSDEVAARVASYVAVHDAWWLHDDEIYADPVLGAFQDLDFVWCTTAAGFQRSMDVRSLTPPKLFRALLADEKHSTRPFTTRTAREMFVTYLNRRRAEFGVTAPPIALREIPLRRRSKSLFSVVQQHAETLLASVRSATRRKRR